MTPLQLLEWKWAEVFKDIPREFLDECIEYEKEVLQDAWMSGFNCKKRCQSPVEYYDKLMRMPHENNDADVCNFCKQKIQ